MQVADFSPGARGNPLDANPRGLYQIVVKVRIHLWLVVLAVFIHSAVPLLADGKMYSEKVNTEIPYQRALILFDEGKETLVLQSQYQIPGGSGNHKLGWVVPVPAVPEIASLKADTAEWLFASLSFIARPHVTERGAFVWLGMLVLSLCIAIIALTASFFPRFVHRRQRLRWVAYIAVLSGILIFLTASLFIRASKGAWGVDVLKSQKTGIFDTKVIRSDSSKDLIAWLQANSFRFDSRDEQAIQSYIDRGWCFVTAKVDASIAPTDRAAVSNKMLAPLILHFPTPKPVYPTALTATGGHPTEILIYIASKEPVKAPEFLTPRFRGEADGNAILSHLIMVEPDRFFELLPPGLTHLGKFKATLTPAQMAKDIEFLPDPGAPPFREHVYRW